MKFRSVLLVAIIITFARILAAQTEQSVSANAGSQVESGQDAQVVVEVRYATLSDPAVRYSGITSFAMPKMGCATVIDEKQTELLWMAARGDRRAGISPRQPNLKIADGKQAELLISGNYDPGLLEAKLSEDRKKVQLSFSFPKDKDGREISPPVSETVLFGETFVMHTAQYVSEGRSDPTSFWDKYVLQQKPVIGREVQEGFFLLTPRYISVSLQDGMTLDKLVDAHQKALAEVKTADVILDCHIQSLKDPDFKEWQRQRWSYSEEKNIERSQHTVFEKELKNGNPVVKVRWEIRRIGAMIFGMNNEPGFHKGGTDSKFYLCRSFRDDEWEPIRDLKTLVQDATSAELVGKTKFDGRDVWQIHAYYDAGKTVRKKPIEFEVFLDPAANYMACKVCSVREMDQYSRIERRWTVKKFADYGSGVFLPIDVNYDVFEDEKHAPCEESIHLVSAVINAPLPVDALDFEIPKIGQVNQGNDTADSKTAEMTVDWLVEANRHALNDIDNASVNMDILILSDKNPEFKIDNRLQWTINRENDTESAKWVNDQVTSNPRQPHIYSVKEYRRKGNMIEYRETGKAKFHPIDKDRPRGIDAQVYLCQKFTGNEDEPARDLTQLVRDSSTTELKGRVQLDGREVWQIHVAYAAEKTIGKQPIEYDLFLDPAVNFMVCKVVSYRTMSGVAKNHYDERRFVVEKFKEFREQHQLSGVYLPSVIEYCIFSDGKKEPGNITIRLTAADVNQPDRQSTQENLACRMITVTLDTFIGPWPSILGDIDSL